MIAPLIGTQAQKPEDVFLPVIGQFAWSVRRGHGSFLMMAFGSPHLRVREPIIARPDRSPRIRRGLARRRVFIEGDWHFRVEHADWTLCVAGETVTSEDTDRLRVDECLKDLDGQRLLSVTPGAVPHACLMTFDLGATVSLQPASCVDADNDQWVFYVRNGDIVSYRTDGRLDWSRRDSRPSDEPVGLRPGPAGVTPR